MAVRSGILILVVVFAIGGFWIGRSGFELPIFTLAADDVARFAAAWGPWSAVASMALMILHSFLPFPAEVIAIANGMLFGSVVGVLVTWSGAMLGAISAFAMTRYMGRPILRFLIADRYWHSVEDWAPRSSTLLLVRLVPVISFNVINCGAGLARVEWWPYLWTTAIGILPLTIVSVGFGSNIPNIGWGPTLLIVVGGAVLLWVAARQPMARYLRAMMKLPAPVDDGQRITRGPANGGSRPRR